MVRAMRKRTLLVTGVAALLAGRAVKRVLVLERHYTAGGFTHSYERAGYEWDVGVHYIGEVGAPTRTRKLFDYLSGGKLEWAPMDDEYDRFYVGDRIFNAIAGKREFRDNLVRQFPNEAHAIDRYIALLDRSGDALSAFGMGRGMPQWMGKAIKPWLNWKRRGAYRQTTWNVLSKLTDDKDLIATLCGQWGDMGMPPKRSPFMAHAMIARHYLYGGYYPVGGAWRIADTIIPKIQAGGGEVFTYARVEEITVADGKVSGVRMQDGHEIQCGCVISSAGVDNTFNHLLPEHVADDAAICVDVGNNTYSFGRYFECRGQRVMMSGYLGSIGFGYPGAMGARAGAPERKDVAVRSDAGFACESLAPRDVCPIPAHHGRAPECRIAPPARSARSPAASRVYPRSLAPRRGRGPRRGRRRG